MPVFFIIQMTRFLAVLLAIASFSLVEARDCTQGDVNNWSNCKGVCCGMILLPPLIAACAACQDQAGRMGWKDCNYVGKPPGYSPPRSSPPRPRSPHGPLPPGSHIYFKRSVDETCPTRLELFDTYAKGADSFDQSAFLQKAKSDVFFDRKTHLKAFDRMDVNGDGQVTFDEMFKDSDL